MNVKKIIKGIMGLSAVGGVAYAAYKLGESNGEINERFREKYGDDEDDIELDDDEDEITGSTITWTSLTMSALRLRRSICLLLR